METHAKSDVKNARGKLQCHNHAGPTSDVLPEVQKPPTAEKQNLGVSTRNTLPTNNTKTLKSEKEPHWFVLRTTYGREKKAYEYLTAHGVEAFYPTIKNVKLIDNKRVTVEESRIPNVFFAYGTEEDIKFFVYDNVNLPYLRFYYRHVHTNNQIVKEPLIVPDNQINSLKIICESDSNEIITSTEEIEKFKEGQKVRIIDGKFKGVVGIVARYHSQQRVGIVIDGLLTVCTAYVPSAFLEEIIKK